MRRSIGIVTALTPHIGYAASARIAKQALHTGRPVEEVATELGLLPAATVKSLLRRTDSPDCRPRRPNPLRRSSYRGRPTATRCFMPRSSGGLVHRSARASASNTPNTPMSAWRHRSAGRLG
ncbi:hypothetical protein ACQPXH_16975 [Nocardia sp. CA-135953]|uniref:hypothetical protein n=1 Tax=Nocardia sp. CA-135953 TaxID=3239978 RepID=UPI003D99C1BA